MKSLSPTLIWSLTWLGFLKNEMKKFLSKKSFKISVLSFLLFSAVVLGLYFRLGQQSQYSFLETNNITSYYFDIAERFNADLVWPQQDVWHFAPGQTAENVPPLTAYFTVYLFRAVNPFWPDLSFKTFVLFLPVLIFLIWAISGFYLIRKLFGAWRYPLFFIILLALAPISISLTGFGHYTEEFLGAFFIFLAFSFFVLWEKEREKIFFLCALLFTVALILTWQQFHIIFVVYGLAAILFLLSGKKKEALDIFTLAGVSLIAAQIFSGYALKSAYLPFQMIYESYLGLAGYNLDFMKLAMSRRLIRHCF